MPRCLFYSVGIIVLPSSKSSKLGAYCYLTEMHYGVKNWDKIGEGVSDRHQNLIDWSLLGHVPSLLKFRQNPFITI